MKKNYRFLFLCLIFTALLFIHPGAQSDNRVIHSQEELLTYLKDRRMESCLSRVGENAPDIEFSCSDTLYSTLKDREFRELFRMMIRAGFDPNIRFSYSDEICFIRILTPAYMDLPWTECENEAQIHQFLGSLPADCRGFVLLLTHELMVQLQQNQHLSWIAGEAGIDNMSLLYSDQADYYEAENIRFFPGTAIVKAARAGNSGGLTSREVDTWRIAQSVADSVRNYPPLLRAQLIHDWICEHVVYIIDEATDEDDNAIGAILNGKANCDGYSDAFFLIGSLAGLNVRCQRGQGADFSAPDSYLLETHMWNLLEIDGIWHMVDVTWDDDEDGMTHIWFNAGMDVAEKLHVWNKDLSVEIAPVTERIVYAENEFFVRSEQELREAVDISAERKFPVFYVIFENPYINYLLEDAIQYVGDKVSDTVIYYSWNEKAGLLKFRDLHWKECYY